MFAGAVCRQILERRGITITANAVRVGQATGKELNFDMKRAILDARSAGDSVGSELECVVTGVPAGVGGLLFGGMESRIAGMLYAIPGVKGVEFGEGFGAARLRGSENNDAFVLRGAKPVFCDISPDNLNIDASKIEELVTPRTRLELSFNYQDRPYYRRTLTSMTWTYSWSNEKYSSFAVRPVDLNLVDMSYINQDFFEKLQNLYLRNSYTSQLVAGISGSYTYNNQLKNPGRNATLVRFNWETAGNLIGGLEHLFSSPAKGKDYYEIFGIQYSQYFRVDLSASRKIMLGEKAAIAGRLYAGCGLAYGNSTSIPFDRLFYCGGSNGMRGWIPRMLGPGSVPVDPDKVTYPVQLGDMKLEANLEFRFPIWGIFHGATFFDVGNIWFMGNSAEEYPPEAVFHIRDFYKQLGFNTGLGIRLDIKFAVLRLDWGIQLHNPNNPAGKRWIHDFKWSNTALNFGVGYPF